jgi:hypothetical protein
MSLNFCTVRSNSHLDLDLFPVVAITNEQNLKLNKQICYLIVLVRNLSESYRAKISLVDCAPSGGSRGDCIPCLCQFKGSLDSLTGCTLPAAASL